MNCLSHSRMLIAILLFLSQAVHAALPTRIGFSIENTVPKLTSLSTQLTAKTGAVTVDLQFVYDPATGFSCTNNSLVDALPVICKGGQSNKNYSLTATNKPSKTKVTLKGKTDGTSARATYHGSKGRLIQKIPAVTLSVDPGPLTSQIVLRPLVAADGSLSGTGYIKSPYGGTGASTSLKGKVKRKSVSWSLSYGADRLTFSGREKNGNWVGSLKGIIGLAKVSQTVTIPLTAQPNPTVAHFQGTVSTSDGISPALVTSGVVVTVKSDLNSNGTIDSGESATAATNAQGAYDLSFAVVEGKQVTLDFALAGYTKTPKTFSSVSLGSVIPTNTTLQKLGDLTLTGQSATSGNGALKFESLPSNISSLKGRVFNPMTETSQFPGEFADDSGNILNSSVFSNVEARDSSNNLVTDLGSGATLKMLVPSGTWSTLGDLQTGNAQIDVPLYYYDETSGQWKRSSSNGWLENETGAMLSEDTLSSIKAGTYSGGLYAAGTITHLSYWNIDWPINTHGCVHGQIVDTNNAPVSGAVITARGLTYTGTSAPQTTGADGSFCFDVMRSEGSNEDLNNNGVTGEISRIALSAYYGGNYYDLGTVTVPPVPATCGTSSCLDLGLLPLAPSKVISSSMCTITGNVVYSGTFTGSDPGLMKGAPITTATVIGTDANAELALQNCVVSGGCQSFAITDVTGAFSLKTVVLYGVDLIAFAYTQSPTISVFYGRLTTVGCPSSPVTIEADASVAAP